MRLFRLNPVKPGSGIWDKLGEDRITLFKNSTGKPKEGLLKLSKKVSIQVGGQAVLGRQSLVSTPWLTERHGYDPTLGQVRRGQDNPFQKQYRQAQRRVAKAV